MAYDPERAVDDLAEGPRPVVTGPFFEGCVETVSQLALAWLLAQGDDNVPIPGTRGLEPVAANVAAASMALTADDLAQIARIPRRQCAG